MAKDILGNELKVGDFVHIQLPSNLTLARITDISVGGLIGNLKTGMQIPGHIQFTIEIGSSFDPNNQIVNVHKLCIPPDSPLLQKDKDAKPN